jgi:hypothetical protein
MGCGKCEAAARAMAAVQQMQYGARVVGNRVVDASGKILCQYRGGKEKHPVYGRFTRKYYGDKQFGQRFYVEELDINASPDLFVPTPGN